ncbi:hypothetical protein GCM10020000_32840 [Streptomyces olivoverticillatus]
MLQGALQLLRTLFEEVAQGTPQHGRTAAAQGAGGVRVGEGGAQVRVDEHHAPRRVAEQRLAQRDRAFQVDLGVHLAERAVHARRPAVRPGHGGGLHAHEDPPAVLGEQRELVHLAAARRLHHTQQPLGGLLGVRLAQRPSGQAPPPHGLLRRPAEYPLGLAVPVGDRAVGVEGAQRGVHPVEEGREQVVVVCVRVRPVAGGAGLVWSGHGVPPAGRVCVSRMPCMSCTSGIQLDPGGHHTVFREISALGNTVVWPGAGS